MRESERVHIVERTSCEEAKTFFEAWTKHPTLSLFTEVEGEIIETLYTKGCLLTVSGIHTIMKKKKEKKPFVSYSTIERHLKTLIRYGIVGERWLEREDTDLGYFLTNDAKKIMDAIWKEIE